jgi:hypothetical protein
MPRKEPPMATRPKYAYMSASCRAFHLLLVCCVLVLTAGCAARRHSPLALPPIMTQSELQRPYTKLGILEYSSQRFGNIDGLTLQDYEWAHGELREGALRLGADAVILPEVRYEHDTFLLFPSSEIKAKGVAIRFQ